MYRILVVFDEYFLGRSLTPNVDRFDEKIVRSAQEFAKYGIHLALATQHTDARHTMHPLLRACIKARIALMCSDGAASEKDSGRRMQDGRVLAWLWRCVYQD
jgi:DNA segregation ATPase FtsK/SpoIIIE-like protein